MAWLDKFKFKAGRKRQIPERETEIYPRLQQLGLVTQQKARLKPTSQNLRYFSRTTYARRAINAIKNPIAELKWEITVKSGVKTNQELERQIAVATTCFNHPNTDDSFRSLIEQVIEDWIIFGAGCIEQQVGTDPLRPLWLWPVDSQSIQIYAGWSGDKNESRYIQTIGYSNVGLTQGRQLRNDELIYIRANPSTETPYGFGAVEIAFNAISRQLGAANYAGNVASNAQPQNLLYLGRLDDTTLRAFRAYWRNEIEGQGQTPILGGENAPSAIKLHTGNDEALYLKYQEFLIREIAIAFDLSPQKLGLEADVNRSTAEVAEDRDWNQAIKPLAHLIAAHLTREVLHAKLGWYQIEFRFIGLDREDEQATASIYQTYYQNNLITPNEQRERLGLPPLETEWANKTYIEAQLALKGGLTNDRLLDENHTQEK